MTFEDEEMKSTSPTKDDLMAEIMKLHTTFYDTDKAFTERITNHKKTMYLLEDI